MPLISECNFLEFRKKGLRFSSIYLLVRDVPAYLMLPVGDHEGTRNYIKYLEEICGLIFYTWTFSSISMLSSFFCTHVIIDILIQRLLFAGYVTLRSLHLMKQSRLKRDSILEQRPLSAITL